MKKIILMAFATVVVTVGVLSQNKSSQKQVSQTVAIKPIDKLKLKQESEAVTAAASVEKVKVTLSNEVAHLEDEVAELENQLASIDIEKEMKSELTSKERRREIINLVNRFTLAMGRLADLEEKVLEEEGAL